ncbi:MAG: hypothetical protein QOJ70_1713 [Acidobacteriota bacterium]|nr:hypothetical protein [Acidobacteriota bacterium]
MAGFNYGLFKSKQLQDPDTGYQIEFYANEEPAGPISTASMGAMYTSGGADRAIAFAQNSTRIYDAFFGKLPSTRIALTQRVAVAACKDVLAPGLDNDKK